MPDRSSAGPVRVIANPTSGGGRARDAAHALIARLEAQGRDVELLLTRGPGEARRWAAETPEATAAVVCVGGDGTLNEIVNGRGQLHYPVAILPTGTANVLARELSLGRNVASVATAILHGRTRRIDLGEANGRLFFAMASVGFDAEVTRLLGAMRRGPINPFSYVRPALRAFARYPCPSLFLRIGETLDPVAALGVVVAKTRNYAGFFRIARRVRVDDGSLEVCRLRHGGRLRLLGYAGGVLTRTLGLLPGVEYHERATRVEITSATATPYQLDGDYAGTTPVRIGVRPGALRLIVDEPSPSGTSARP